MNNSTRIPTVSFSKSFRGYDVAEVTDYVYAVVSFEEESLRVQANLTEKIADLEKEVGRLRDVENSLFRAMKMAEEAQQAWQAKVDKESAILLYKAKKQAEAIVVQAEKDTLKSKMLLENEHKQLLIQAKQELTDQNRELTRIQAVKDEISTQLQQIANSTLEHIAGWLPKSLDQKVEVAVAKKPVVAASKKGVAVEKKPKPTKKKNHLDASTIEDDGLPTLNKVLEAFAKSAGPRGKVGDIN